jgi:ribosomal RNA-processing protein 36
MGKGRKKQTTQEYQFDEASSGSDDSDSDGEEENKSLPVRGNVADNANHNSDDDNVDESGNNSSNNNNSSDSNVDSENEEKSNNNRPDDSEDDNSDHEQEEDDDDDDDFSENEADAPLHQRLLKKEGRGSLQRSSRRERKSRALEEATKRLASFKKESQRKKRKQKEMTGITGDDDDDDEGVETSSSNRNRNTKPMTTTATTTHTTTKKKKKSKNKPTEVSSKRADFFARGARRLNESGLGVDIGAHRYKPMDPRASNLSGHFDEDRFHNNYAFLEELRNKEIGEVRKRITAHKATGNKGNRLRRKLQINHTDRNNGVHSSTLEEDVARLKALTETRANLERGKIDRAAKQSVKRKIRDDVESGKTGVYFLKRKEQKRLELEARFEEIRKRGGEKAVEKILAKKRQKNKSRDASDFAK